MTNLETNITFDIDNQQPDPKNKVYVKFIYQFKIDDRPHKTSAKTKVFNLDGEKNYDYNMMPCSSEILEFHVKFPENFRRNYIFKLSDNDELKKQINQTKKLNIDIILGKYPIITINENIKHQASKNQKIKRFLLF